MTGRLCKFAANCLQNIFLYSFDFLHSRGRNMALILPFTDFQAAFFDGGHDCNLRRKRVQVNRETHEGGNDLSQGDSAVVGRNALMPVWPEAFLFQPGGRFSVR